MERVSSALGRAPGARVPALRVRRRRLHRRRPPRGHCRGGAAARPDTPPLVMTTIVGIFREPAFSPGRVGDDAAILEQTAAALAVLDRAATRVPVLNSAAAIRNCFRAETVRLLGAAGVPFPPTSVIASDAAA